MYKVSEIRHQDLPVDGMSSLVKGKFYYRIAENGRDNGDYANCFIADSNDSDSPRLYLPNEVGEAVIDEDETFGMMVGGEFAYYDIDGEIDCVIKKTTQGLVCETVRYLKLEKDGDFQEFNFKRGD